MSVATKENSLWPKAIAIYFAIVIVSIAGFIIWAVRQNIDLVRKDYYAEELKFQEQLNRIHRTRQLHSTAAIGFDSQFRVVRLSIPNASSDARGIVQFYRPSDAALDKSVKLSLDSNGIQEIDGTALQPGFWKVRVSWSDGTKEFFTESSIIISEK